MFTYDALCAFKADSFVREKREEKTRENDEKYTLAPHVCAHDVFKLLELAR